MRSLPAVVALACLVGTAGSALAQDMEPRAYSASPVGVNFLVVSFSRSTGSVVFDPSLPLSDVHATVDGVAAGLGHTFNLFGKLGLLSVATPYALGDVTGNVGDARHEVTRSGLADSRLKLSANLRGNDAMSPREFAAAPRRVVLGTSLTVTMPASQYDSAKLINIGTNRWSLKPEFGVSVPRGHWDLDAYVGGWIYFDNPDAYPGGAVRSQDPILTIQGHASYTIRRGFWVAGDATWYRGGSARTDGGTSSTPLNNARVGVTMSLPVRKRFTLKAAYTSGIVERTGTNFRTVSIAWQTVWLSPHWSGR
jgi:outer membrane putative beta-barrel porin/alpha-amylase